MTTSADLTLAMSDNMKYFIGDGIGFLFVIAVLMRYLVPVAMKGMTARQETIGAQLAAAQAAGERLVEAEAAYANAVAAAKVEAEKLQAEARVQYDAIVAEATAAAAAKAEEVTVRAREAMEAERVSAVRALQAEIASMTVETAERKVRAALADDGVQRRVTDRFLAELESGRVAASTSGENR